jgi:hypothetical protein
MKRKARPASATSAHHPVAPTVVLSPSEQLRPLSASELDVLEQIGNHWAEVLRRRGGSPHTLPVDPSLGRYAQADSPTRFGRIARVRISVGSHCSGPGLLCLTDGDRPVNYLP